MGEREVQRNAAAHREAAEHRPRDAELVHELAQVLDRVLLRVRGGVLGNRRRRIAPVVVDEQAELVAQHVDLSVPALAAAGELVGQHEPVALPVDLVVQLDAVDARRAAHARSWLHRSSAVSAYSFAPMTRSSTFMPNVPAPTL